MSWLFWLAVAVIVTAVVAVFGSQPKGTRPIEYTHMMGVARFILVAVVVIVAYAVFRASAGG